MVDCKQKRCVLAGTAKGEVVAFEMLRDKVLHLSTQSSRSYISDFLLNKNRPSAYTEWWMVGPLLRLWHSYYSYDRAAIPALFLDPIGICRSSWALATFKRTQSDLCVNCKKESIASVSQGCRQMRNKPWFLDYLVIYLWSWGYDSWHTWWREEEYWWDGLWTVESPPPRGHW